MISIDAHEPKEIRDILSLNYETETRKLISGDYAFFFIAIERKAMPDLFTSIKSGRLFNQLRMMKKMHIKCYLLIEGLDLRWIRKTRQFYNVCYCGHLILESG